MRSSVIRTNSIGEKFGNIWKKVRKISCIIIKIRKVYLYCYRFLSRGTQLFKKTRPIRKCDTIVNLCLHCLVYQKTVLDLAIICINSNQFSKRKQMRFSNLNDLLEPVAIDKIAYHRNRLLQISQMRKIEKRECVSCNVR